MTMMLSSLLLRLSKHSQPWFQIILCDQNIINIINIIKTFTIMIQDDSLWSFDLCRSFHVAICVTIWLLLNAGQSLAIKIWGKEPTNNLRLVEKKTQMQVEGGDIQKEPTKNRIPLRLKITLSLLGMGLSLEGLFVKIWRATEYNQLSLKGSLSVQLWRIK